MSKYMSMWCHFDFTNFFSFSSIFIGNQTLTYCTLSVHFLELVSLLGLSIVSSLENFDIHKICFGTFVICSLIYFALTIRLWTGSWRGVVFDHSFDGLKDFNNLGKIDIINVPLNCMTVSRKILLGLWNFYSFMKICKNIIPLIAFFSLLDKKSLETKRLVLKTYFVCGLLCTFFYWQHNTYCYPNIYSFFCLFEYVIVLGNFT